MYKIYVVWRDLYTRCGPVCLRTVTPYMHKRKTRLDFKTYIFLTFIHHHATFLDTVRLILYFVPAGPETLNDPPNVTLAPCLSFKGCGERRSDWIFTGTLSSIIGKVDIISTKLQLGAKTNPAIPGTAEKK